MKRSAHNDTLTDRSRVERQRARCMHRCKVPLNCAGRTASAAATAATPRPRAARLSDRATTRPPWRRGPAPRQPHPCRPACRRPAIVRARRPRRRNSAASTAAAGALCATSRIHSAFRCTTCMRPGSRTRCNPATAAMAVGAGICPGRAARHAHQAASAVAALRYWISPASCGAGKGPRRSGALPACSNRQLPSSSTVQWYSRPATRTSHPSVAAAPRTEVGSAASPSTTRCPGRKMPAFSRPICSSESPSQSMWSMPTEHSTAMSASTILVASSLPPSPTSRTTTSVAACAKS